LVGIVALICAAYLFIGANRLAHGGVELFQSNTLAEWILGSNLRDADPASTAGVRWIGNPVTAAVGRLGFPLLTALEISAPLCLLSTRYRWFFLPSMLVAHVGILALMRIDFTDLSLALLLFIDSRHWSPARSRSEAPGVVYFDGVCGLCNGFVDFVLQRDRGRRLRVATLQGATAAGRFGPAAGDPASIVYEEDGVILERSAAVLRILGRLGGPWSLFAFFGLVPRPLRDWVYDWVARHRYGWFGRRDTCRLPTAEERAFFLP
jgi:predicted DCC family thiol-disulfide oxidoreductase YuxK